MRTIFLPVKKLWEEEIILTIIADVEAFQQLILLSLHVEHHLDQDVRLLLCHDDGQQAGNFVRARFLLSPLIAWESWCRSNTQEHQIIQAD